MCIIRFTHSYFIFMIQNNCPRFQMKQITLNYV